MNETTKIYKYKVDLITGEISTTELTVIIDRLGQYVIQEEGRFLRHIKLDVPTFIEQFTIDVYTFYFTYYSSTYYNNEELLMIVENEYKSKMKACEAEYEENLKILKRIKEVHNKYDK